MEMEDQTDGKTEDTTDGKPEDAADGPSGAYETEDGQLVLYEEQNPDAYVRSDLFVVVER